MTSNTELGILLAQAASLVRSYHEYSGPKGIDITDSGKFQINYRFGAPKIVKSLEEVRVDFFTEISSFLSSIQQHKINGIGN